MVLGIIPNTKFVYSLSQELSFLAFLTYDALFSLEQSVP